MKIVEFGGRFNEVKRFDYLSTVALLEFDLLLIDFTEILSNSHQKEAKFYERRRKDLEEFIVYKNIPIVYFTPYPRSIPVLINGIKHSKDFDFFAPIPKIETESQTGSEMEIEPNTIFADFVIKYKDHFYYDAYFNSIYGATIVSTPLVKKPIGFWSKDCVFLPQLRRSILEVEAEFINDLYLILKDIRVVRQKLELPEWTNKYLLPKEGELIDNINSIENQIKALNEDLQKKNKLYQTITTKKSLFVASGFELESHIEKVLFELGFEILETENNREDLIVKYKNKIAVIEIKGVNSSSAERHAAQLEKWSAEYFERTETKPKPILLVNAYKDKPLIERNEPVFPNQMLKYSTSRDHCLISTLQLLGLYYYIQDHPTEVDNQIEKLFATVGIYNEFSEWNEFITLAP